MKKGKLFSSMAFVLSLVMLAVSGAVFVHTATQQSATSTLQVTYDARNVNFTADAWYEKPSNSGTKQAFTDNTLTVNATAAESTTSTLSVTDPITLNANPDTYVLFTYKFVNTASNGGYDMLVSLTDGATKTNVKVKYYTSVISDTNPSMYSTLSSQKDTVENGGSSSVPADVCVPAQSTLYYYVLVEIDDNTIGSSYTGDNDHKITWTISSANTKGATMYSVSFDANGGTGNMKSQSYTSGTQQALTTNSLEKEGYTFAGWSTTPNGSVVYTNQQALTLSTEDNGAQIVLYAVWDAKAKLEASISFAYDSWTVGHADFFTFLNPLTNTGDGVVTYSSSNPNIEVYSDTGIGKSYTNAPQTTIITATVEDSETYHYAVKTASYTLTVENRCCVTGDTLIAMADGTQKRADEIVVGDRILSYNELTGEVEEDEVSGTPTFLRDILITITFTDGSIIKVSDDHPLLTELGWKCWDPEFGAISYPSIEVYQETFVIGDRLFTLKQNNGTVFAEFDKTIASITYETCGDGRFELYTFRVLKNHNYFSEYVLSHNVH